MHTIVLGGPSSRRSLPAIVSLACLLAIVPAQAQTNSTAIGPIETHVQSLQNRFDQLESSRRAWISSDWDAARTLARRQDLELASKLAATSSIGNASGTAASLLDRADPSSHLPSPISASLRVPPQGSLPTGKPDRDPLFGLVIAVKDNIDVAGFATTAGSRSLAGNVARSDATVVSRLRKRGVIFPGKTNLDTFARGVRSKSEIRGTTSNAWNPKRAAGGSSGGSAVAIASGMVDAALGTDTCGSLRYPATYNGVYALRPTAGTLSRHGVVPLSPTQDVVGPMASSPTILRELFLAMLGPDPLDPATLDSATSGSTAAEANLRPPEATSQTFRVGVLRGFGSYALDARGRTVLDILRIGGVELVPTVLPKGVVNASLIDQEADAAIASFRASLQRNATTVRAPTIDESKLGNTFATTRILPWLETTWRPNAKPRWNELRAQQRLNAKLITDLLNRERLDALVYPTTPFPAAVIGASQPSANCWLSATSGLPALALPGGFDTSTFPTIGVDLLGKAGSELMLLDIAQKAAPTAN
jgi:amidase